MKNLSSHEHHAFTYNSCNYANINLPKYVCVYKITFLHITISPKNRMILVHRECTVIAINSRDTAQQNGNKKSLNMQKCSQTSSMQMK